MMPGINRVLKNSKNHIKSTLRPIVLKLTHIVVSTPSYNACNFGEPTTNITETVISLCGVGTAISIRMMYYYKLRVIGF